MTTPNPRVTEADADCMFTDRWSPRAFASDPIPVWQVRALFEAARWSPSCFNEQPCRFVYALTEEARALFASVLAAKNQAWASRAPLLVFVIARVKFAHGGKPNRHAVFDAGAAWMSLALQARRFGLYAHAMAGFSEEKAREILGVSKDEYHVMAAVAVGRRGDPAVLPDDLKQIEAPNERNPLGEVAAEFGDVGRFKLQIV